MGAVHYCMSDIYGGYAGTTEKSIPDADDQNALTDVSTAENKPTHKVIEKSSNKKLYMALILVLILVVVFGGRF